MVSVVPHAQDRHHEQDLHAVPAHPARAAGGRRADVLRPPAAAAQGVQEDPQVQRRDLVLLHQRVAVHQRKCAAAVAAAARRRPAPVRLRHAQHGLGGVLVPLHQGHAAVPVQGRSVHGAGGAAEVAPVSGLAVFSKFSQKLSQIRIKAVP